MKMQVTSAGSSGFGWVRTLLAFRHQNPIGRLVSALLAFAIAALLVVGVGVPAAQAASPCPRPGGFEIDGDMTQETCTPGGDDWNTPGIGVQSTAQGGTYKTAGKDDSDPLTWESSGSTPDKTNFERAYATSRVANGHFYVYVAWERTQTSGTQGYAIEIDNSGARVGSDGTPQPDRSSGGSVFYISSQGSAAPEFNSACSFTSQSNYGQTCVNSDASVTSAINTATISDPFAGTSQVAGSFFEVALDVTALTGIVPSCPGASAASVYLRSITGQTHNGNLKGYMAPLTVAPNSTCVEPPITTTATPGGDVNAPGSAQHDTVTVGTAQAPGVGSVEFFLCSPAVVAANGGDCSANGTKVGATKTLDASGQASSDQVTGSTTPSDTATGRYCWRAEFTPSADDHHYFAGSHTNSTTECFTIVHGSPEISTQISVTGDHAPGLGFTTVGDTAQLTGFVGSVAGETITFDLYGPFDGSVPADCTDGPLAFSTSGTLDASGQATTSQTFEPTAAGSYVWIASYAGSALNDPVAGTCSDSDESVTIVGAQVDVTKSANPPGPVSAGTDIGFDIVVSNDGSVPAKDVHVHDTLPAGADGVTGGDLDWQLDPAYDGCTITGAPGSQVLDCTFDEVTGPGALSTIHVSSPTSPADCGTVKNKATITTSNGTGTDSDVATVTVLCPHLVIEKTADAASVDVGSPIGFTVTVRNDGDGTASGVLLDDPLPAGPGIVWSIDPAGSSGPLSCLISSGTLTCTGSLDSGAEQVVHVTSPTEWTGGVTAPEVNSCLGGPENDGVYPNTAQVSATNVVDSPSDDATTSVLCPDLDIVKDADADAVNAGTAIGFTITATNSGSGSATGALVEDPLPDGVTWSIESSTGPLDCGISNGTLSCTGTLGSGATQTVHITAPTSFASCGTYDNTATLTATNTPQAPSDDASTSVLCADVVVQKDADHDAPVTVGTPIGFTVTITNAGDGDALGVDVEDLLPAGGGVDWSIDSSVGPLTCSIDGTAPNQTLSCSGNLAETGSNGDAQTVHVTSSTVWNATDNSCGTYDNTATLRWDNGPDRTITSNEATETVECPDVTLTKTADADTVDAGDQIGFTITVSNSDVDGTGKATDVTVDDLLPSGDGVDWSIESGPQNCTIQGDAPSQTLECTAIDLDPGEGEVIHLVSATSFDSCATYPNTASLTATNHPALTATATTTVQCADVSFTKTADADPVDAGDQIGFTVTAANSDADGTGTAHGVVIDDPLPDGPGIDWSIESGPAGCTIEGAAPSQTLQCTGVDLAPGENESVHVVSGTTFESCATYVNVASLMSDNHPALQATADTTVQCPAVVLTKTADDAVVTAGGQIGFTITATNSDADGTGTAHDVVVDDPLPAGGGVSWTIAPGGPAGCTIDGTAPTQTLHCAAVDLAPGESETVHVVSRTTIASCLAYPNTASLTAGNHPSLEASATTSVTGCVVVSPPPPPEVVPPSLPNTGGPSAWSAAAGLVLVLGGSLLVLGDQRRRRRS